MLKKIAKRIMKEVEQAKDYVEQGYLVKHTHRDLADLFISLAGEEIEHAERLLKAGFNAIDEKKPSLYTKDEGEKENDEHFEKCKVMWDWTYRFVNDTIVELKYKISNYKR